MSLWRLTGLVLLLAAAVALGLSNPTMDEYLRFVEQELGKAINRMDQRTPAREQEFIRAVFRTQSKKLLDGVVRPHTVRRNWGLFSHYETHVAETRLVVLGVAGRFIPIEGLEETTVKIGRMIF